MTLAPKMNPTGKNCTLPRRDPAGENRRPTPPTFAYISLFLLGLLVAAGLQNIRDSIVRMNQREVVRVSSPDRKLDAVFVEPMIKAIGQGSAVCLVPKGDRAPVWGCVLNGSAFSDAPRLYWPQRRVLQISYERGCIDNFSNLWRSYDIDASGEIVDVRLVQPARLACIRDRSQDALAAGAVISLAIANR
jgi:hypothetical protein